MFGRCSVLLLTVQVLSLLVSVWIVLNFSCSSSLSAFMSSGGRFKFAPFLPKSTFMSVQFGFELAHCWSFADPRIISFEVVVLLFAWLVCCSAAENLTNVVGCLSWAAAASTVGKRSPPSRALWGWTTAGPCPITACSVRFTMTQKMRTMRWAMLTPSKMISMSARWASNPSLLATYLMTSSCPSSGRLKKMFTYRRSNWALRGDPGIRGCKASGVGELITTHTCTHKLYLIYTHTKQTYIQYRRVHRWFIICFLHNVFLLFYLTNLILLSSHACKIWFTAFLQRFLLLLLFLHVLSFFFTLSSILLSPCLPPPCGYWL